MPRTPTLWVPGRHLFRFVATLAALVLLLASGATAPARGSSGASANTLRISLFAGIENLDPGRAYYTIDWQLLNPVCAKLVTYPDLPAPEGFRVQPEVAAAMPTISADGKTYTFRVRDDFTFSSGEKVTAQTFKSVIDRVASPNVGSPGAWLLSDIVGFEAVNQGNASSVSGVVASGDTLTITLTHPSGDFLTRLALPFSCAMPLGTPKTPVVSAFASAGPYYIDSYVPAQSIVLKPNPYYTGPRPRFFDEIDYTLGVQQDQAYLQLLNGHLDYAADGLASTVHEAGTGLYDQYGPESPAAALGRQRYFVNPTSIIDFLALNTTAGRPFANVKLRQAVNYALDRAAIAAIRGAHAATPTAQYLPASIPGFRDEAIYPLDGPDVAKAEALIAEAGGPPAAPIVVYATGSTLGQLLVAQIKAELEAVGFTVDVQLFPSGVFTKCGHRGEPFDICLTGWSADYPDPYDFMKLFDGRTIQDEQNNNISYFDDPAFNAKLDAANALSGGARYAAFGDLDVELARDSAPWASLDYRNQREFFSDRIGGQIYQAPYESIDLATLYLRPGISIEDVTLVEGNGGSESALFTVSLSSVESGPVTVEFATSDETATAGSDYTATSGTLTIPAGERSATVSVPVSGEKGLEPDETLALTLTNPSSGTITAASGRATIVNDDSAPVAQAQAVSTNEDTAKPITLDATDANSDALTYGVVGAPTHGSLSGSGLSRTYTPNPDYNGPDSFSFKASDGANDSNLATVSVTVNPVNDAPVANAQSVATKEDTAKPITLAATDIEGDALTYAVVQAPAHGVLTGSGANRTYTPAANYNGPDSFSFRASDGSADSNVAAVSLTVTPVADARLAVVSRSLTVTKTRVAPVKLRCGAEARCQGTLALSARVKGRLVGSRRAFVKLTLGSRSFSIAPGRTATVNVKLTANGYKLLVRVERLSAQAKIRYKQPAGGTTTTTRTITLRAPARR
jgi:ABC-type transport system substrate-binding protein